MPINPWQEVCKDAARLGDSQTPIAGESDGAIKRILFILDAANSVEQKILVDWLDKTKIEAGFSGEANSVLVNSEGFEDALAVPDHTMLAPIRVMWKSKLDNPNVADADKPRWRDLLRGNPRRPSRRKAKRIFAKDPNRAICVMGVPASLGWLKTRFEERRENAIIDKDLAEFIMSQVSLALEVAERRLRGSRYKVPTQVARNIQVSDRFKRGLQIVMAETGEEEATLRERAKPIFKELVAIPHNFWQDVMATFNRWVIRLGYENELVIDDERLARFRKIVREQPTALLWTHKTHMDGLTMQTVLFENDFPTPHTMGGINMAFAGVGFLARRSGAIFIRRSFQDNPLYKLVLRNYLSYLLEKRFPLTWSFEGTRSRIGKLMPPKYGMLKYVTDAVSDSNADSLAVIPVAINYDMINDVKDYAHEQSGGVKRPESLGWFISYLRRLRRPLGRIYVDFGEPVIINREEFSSENFQLTKTALKVGYEANRVTPVTYPALMCMSLLGAAPRALTLNEINTYMSELRQWGMQRNIPFTSDFDDDNEAHMQEIIDAMATSDLVARYDEGTELIYGIDADQHAMVSYYRNTIVHHFVIKAIIELSLMYALKRDAGIAERFWHEANRLKDLFKFEFFYAPAADFRKEVETELSLYDEDWARKFDSDKNFAKQFMRGYGPYVAHATLLPYIEAYRVVIDVFAKLSGDQTLDEKATVAAAFKYAKQAYLQRRISSKGSVAELLFKNAYKLLTVHDLHLADGNAVVQRRKKASQRLRVLAHRLETIRAMAMDDG